MQKRTQELPFLGSITDLMTSVAVIFIMLLVMFMAHYQRAIAAQQKELSELQWAKPILGKRSAQDIATIAKVSLELEKTQSIKKELKQELAKHGYQPEDDRNDVLAIVYHAQSEKLQFDVDRADLKEGGKTFLQKFIPTLAQVLGSDRFYRDVQSIVVEGHTDSDGDDQHNLQLSQKRSFAVLLFGLSGCGLDATDKEKFLNLTSITGRGERGLLPQGSKPGHEDKTRSRRVEFIIRVKSIEQHADFAQLKTRLPAGQPPDGTPAPQARGAPPGGAI